VFKVPPHGAADPVMVPGCAGILLFTVTANVCANDEQEPLFAVTETLPLVALAVALIEVVVDAPVQSPGKIQV
jgi:hypothetical protein